MIKPTLVLGASLKPIRYSNIAIQRLQQYNHPIIAVGLKAGITHGQEVITFESAFAKAETHRNTIDTVTLYISPQRQDSYMEYVVSLKPKRVVFNPGTENPEFYKVLKENNIPFEIACTLVLLGTNQY
ncbi:CoA-binding protein [uncultured Dokdonia sp.]|uniref:CoA-binding protein n=1 Tax=uncultured Dokdonia sp. TaxID=575653 RepID=UPI00262C9A01|nr:CoA-binding protein [uncultured Dokdonia sp.]